MTTERVLRIVGGVDVLSGAAALVAASWLAEQLGVGTMAVRIAAVALVVIGIDTLFLATRSPRAVSLAAKGNAVVEGVAALLAVDLLVLSDTTTLGLVLLAGTAVYCAAACVYLATRQRAGSASLVAA